MLTAGIIALVTHTKRKIAIVFILGLIGLGLTSCGDDDSTVASDNGGNTTTTASSDDHMSTDDTDMDDESGDDEAPDTNPCAEGGSGEMPGMETMAPEDGATEVTIQAKEYEFGGTDAFEGGGMFAVTFENQGTELHELHVARLDDGEERSMEEFFQDPDAESMTTEVGHVFACPGTISEPAGVDMSEPGRYVVVCFIPTGAMADTDPADFGNLGAPHAMNGMAVEIVVE